jgi:hypothetical protein
MTMETSEARDRLIALIYEAALQESLWPKVLTAFSYLAGCAEATLVGFRKSSEAGAIRVERIFSFTSGRLYSPEAHEIYRNQYSKIDAVARRAFYVSTGELILSRALIPEDIVKRDQYFQEFLIPNGVRELAGWNLENSDKSLVSLSFHSGGALCKDDLIRFAGLTSHIRRSLSIAATMRQRSDEEQSLRAILESEGVSFLIVNRRRKMLECSQAAAHLFETGQVLHLRPDGSVSTANAWFPTDRSHRGFLGASGRLQNIWLRCDPGEIAYRTKPPPHRCDSRSSRLHYSRGGDRRLTGRRPIVSTNSELRGVSLNTVRTQVVKSSSVLTSVGSRSSLHYSVGFADSPSVVSPRRHRS